MRLYKVTLKEKFEAQKQEGLPTEPTGKHYGKYLVNRHGVWTRQNAGTADLYVWRRIARTRIDPVALSRDTSPQRNWRHRYFVTDETGEFPVEIGKEKLGKRADSAITILMKHGVHVVESDEARHHLATFLRFKPRARIIRAPKVGWFEARKGNWAFVVPDETLGNDGNDEKHNITLDAVAVHRSFRRSGTSEQWREQVAKPLAGNSSVVLAVGTFIAAPLLRWADEPGGGFHMHGAAKVGKTLISAIGQSVWGKPYAPGAGANCFGYTWETTAARLSQRAVLHSDIGLSLDEIGIGERKAIASAAYALAGGLGKGRFGQAEQDFNILFFSTGELSLAEFLPNARQGQLVRMVDIPAVVRPEGAFETIPNDLIAVAGREFYSATAEYHGAVGYDWLRHLVALGPKQIKAELKRLRESWWALPQVVEIANRADPQVISVINRFALVTAALHMATAAEIVPWSVDDINTGIIACMSRWLQQRGNVDTGGELLRGIKYCRQLIAATIGDRFIRLTLKNHRLVPASAADQRKMRAERDGKQKFDGYVKDGRILVKADAWHHLWAGLDIDAVKQCLLQAELLLPGRDGVVRPEKIGGKTTRFYVLAPAFIDNVTT